MQSTRQSYSRISYVPSIVQSTQQSALALRTCRHIILSSLMSCHPAEDRKDTPHVLDPVEDRKSTPHPNLNSAAKLCFRFFFRQYWPLNWASQSSSSAIVGGNWVDILQLWGTQTNRGKDLEASTLLLRQHDFTTRDEPSILNHKIGADTLLSHTSIWFFEIQHKPSSLESHTRS